MARLKGYPAKFCLLLASCCVALLLLEGIVRVFFPYARDHVLPGRVFDIDDYLGWKLKAEKQVIHRSRYFNVVYTTNSLGFRDKLRHRSKNKEIYRVLLYGDSQVFGWGVPEDRRFSNLLEAHMPSLELWNLAIPAYGLDQQILSYEREGASLNADEVIFFVSEETLRRTHRDYMDGRYKPMFVKGQHGLLQVAPPKQVAIPRLLYEVLSPLYLPHFVNRRLKMLHALVEGGSNKRGPGADRDTITSSGRTGNFEEEILNIARDIAVERKHKITVLATLPHAMRKALQEFCGRKGIGFLAIDFDNVSGSLVLGRDDPHWNLQAHQLVAEQMLSQVDWHIARGQSR